MGKFEEFGKYLEDQKNNSFSITFGKIEEIIGEKLPDSAYKHSEWWSNSDSHVLMKEVLSKNWKSRNLNLEDKSIEFFSLLDSSLLEFLKNKRPTFANYQPLVIKLLLEKGTSKNFSVSLDEIKEKIILLNFNRKDFQIKNAINSVLPALKNYILEKEDFVSLNENCFSNNDIDECLTICNKEIAKWHVSDVIKKENRVYIIQAGSEGDWLHEFQESKTAGVSYHEHGKFDLTGMTKEEIETKTNGKAGTELYNISQITKGDIVAITLGSKKGIENFGIVTSGYHFDLNSQTYVHRVNLEYLNFGTTKINSDTPKAIIKSNSLEEQIKQFLLGEEEHEYFILWRKVDSRWEDVSGRKYHFGKTVPNQKKLRNAGIGTKTIWFTKENGDYYFWGYGTVKEIEVVKDDAEWNLVYGDFRFFEKQDGSLELEGQFLKHGDESIKEQITHVENFNNQHPITRITKKIYQQIIGEDLTSEEDELDTMSMDNYDRALEWKPNLILYGPPGTGKTYHANKIAEKVAGSIPILKEHTWKSLVILVLLENEGKPMNYHEIAKIALAKNLISTKGETPHETIAKDMRNDMEQKGKDSFFVKPEDGVYGLNIPTTFEKTAEIILLAENRLMHTDDITEIAINRKMIIQRDEPGVTPNRSMNQILSQDVKNNNLDSKFINIGPGTYGLRSQITNTKKSLIYKVTFHPSYSYEDFVEGYRPDIDDKTSSQYELKKGIFYVACKTAKENPDSKTVLIIDEINRGNIPKILGELITLLEEDKRKKKYALNLAYSQDEFFVPENLRIIGTMNTADKSLMQMDDALKRRFVFEELMPDTNALLKHLKDEHVKNAEDYKKILDRINDKILGKGSDDAEQRMKQFRDRQIGHSYFWNIKNAENLQSAIKYDIIPLLQDYFYGDYDEIRKILGDEIISENNRTTSLVNNRNEANDLKDKLLKI